MQDDFLSKLSQPRPDPGGGAASAHGGLLALAVMEKIAQLELRRRHGTDDESDWKSLLGIVRRLTESLSGLRERDCAAYLQLARVRANGVQVDRLQDAWTEAVECPIMIIKTSTEAMPVLSAIGTGCSKHLVPDLLVAVEFLAATVRSAGHIAAANVDNMACAAIPDHHLPNVPSLVTTAEREIVIVRERLGRRIAQPLG
jgi:formiminotetrahydrofolate cyclodeaminase